MTDVKREAARVNWETSRRTFVPVTFQTFDGRTVARRAGKVAYTCWRCLGRTNTPNQLCTACNSE